MCKRAIILAGGKGTRLKPYTISLPKPLVPVGDMPVLEIVLRQLKQYGFNHITITLNHLAEIIKAYFGDGEKWGMTIDYTYETMPLSTMGPLTLIHDLPDNFLIMNGDILTDINFNHLFEYHKKSNSLITIGAKKREERIDYGVLMANDDSKLIAFDEKPYYNFLVSMGVYIANREVLNYIPADTFFGFDHLMNTLISKEMLPNVFVYDGYWLDIGRPDDYEAALEIIKRKKFYE